LLAKTGKGSASVALLVTVIAIAAVFVYLSDSDGTGASTPSRSGDSAAETASVVSAEALPVFHDNPEAAKPFPALMPPSRYEHPVVSRAYEIAHEIPDVLAQQPCYCYCKNFGSREPSRLLGL
jgi:hypothetical protein